MHMRDLVGMGHHFLPSEPTKWNVEDVYEFIRSLPGKAHGSPVLDWSSDPWGRGALPSHHQEMTQLVTQAQEQPCRDESVRSLPGRTCMLLQDTAVNAVLRL